MKAPAALLAAVAVAGTVPAPALAPPGETIAQVRVARATPRLDRVVQFYRDGLGLPVLAGFEGHAGYDGVMLGLPGAGRHLEFTEAHAEHKLPQPHPETLLVLYYDTVAERDRVVTRLQRLGHGAVPPANPYWLGKAITVPDPDGFLVVLFAGRWDTALGTIPQRFVARPP
jgi:catechol 2,3-dioxygenase-like lactoylglutathione lyase family enzyme